MIDVVIVGFGFSAVPLLRELEATRTAFTIISAEESSIWDGLSKHDRLGFDLVSSYLTSFYSFDLAEDFEQDHYPTARQFYAMHKKWRAVYADKIVRDAVIRVDNYRTHSVVHTQSGQTYEARHVVFATGFSRGIFKDLTTLDFNAPNQTFVFDTMGDSANLLISHLIPRNVKIIIRTNGFHARDKVVPIQGTTYTLDQLEFHNYRYVSHDHYASVIHGVPLGSGNPILLGDQFPASVRDESHNPSKARPASGTVAIKYWPIDEYCRNFGNNLESAISNGYALNDLTMWLHTGRAIVVPKQTPIDFERKTITYGGIERPFDRYVSGDAETPRLPPIMIDGQAPFAYQHRDTFMGVIPSTLHNCYTIGYTRPYTGGLANIIEMQGLLVHKLVTQPAFHSRIHRNLDERIAAYNEHYFGNRKPRRYDHLVYYGFFTDDVARLIGIDHKLSDCKSLQDLMFYYAFPNNAFKYRLKGEYAVAGVDRLIEKVNRQFSHFIISFAYLLSSGLVDPANLTPWLLQARRNMFNDMRHKELYRVFLEHYLQAYRQLKNVKVAEAADPQWDALVAKACETRDRAVARIQKPARYQLDEDVAREIQLLTSWMASGHDVASIRALNLDPKRAAMWASLVNPTEYELPFL
ncbi:MAG: thioredoxin reductase [Lentisphaerae bacterium]|nr:thioredoxin reductase [Lentisphaerota bacterium]